MNQARLLFCFLVGFSVCFQAFAAPPSFDCRKARTPLALTICDSSAASAADWELVSSYWAAYGNMVSEDGAMFRAAHLTWLRSLDGRCGLSSRDAEAPTHATCVTREYLAKAEEYRKSLSGDAHLEASLSADEHKRIQASLIALGYPNQGEGIFGVSTRQGIADYQRSHGQTPTGFLRRSEVAALLGSGNDASRRVAQDRVPNDEEAAQAAMMGIIGGWARGQGLLPQPSVRPRPRLSPPVARADPSQVYIERKVADRFGGQGAASFEPIKPPDSSELSRTKSKEDGRFGEQGSVSFSPSTSAQGPADTAALRTVEVEGSGDTIEEAKADASRQAVQQVAGLYVDARRRVEAKASEQHVSDVVEEKIISYTNAYVKKVEVLRTEKHGEMFTVGERVSVAVAPLIKVLQENAVPTVAFDADTAAGTADTLAKEKQGAVDMYADLLARASSLVSVGVGKPEIDPLLPSGTEASWLSIPITFKVNRDARAEWRSKFRLFANERETIRIPIAEAKLNGGSDGQTCSAPLMDVNDMMLGGTRNFLHENTPNNERGAAACFVDADSDGGGVAECYGRKFVVDAKSFYNPCSQAGPCLFMKEKTKNVHLVIDMTDKDGKKIISNEVSFGNFPAINVRSSADRPISSNRSFFNYCVPRQDSFFAEASLENSGLRFGDILFFPAEDSRLRAYYNTLIPNDKIGRIASISAKLVQGE